MKKLKAILLAAVTLACSVTAHAATDNAQQGSTDYDFAVARDIQDAVDAGRRITQDQQQTLDKELRAERAKLVAEQEELTKQYKQAQENYDDRGVQKAVKLIRDNDARIELVDRQRLSALDSSRGWPASKAYIAQANEEYQRQKSAQAKPDAHKMTQAESQAEIQRKYEEYKNSQQYKELQKHQDNLKASSYGSQLSAAIAARFYDISSYSGKRCTLRLDMNRDGTLNAVNSFGGDKNLCAAAVAATKQAKLPVPPNEAVYQIFKNAPLDFKP